MIKQSRVYLDFAASTPLDKDVLNAMAGAYGEFANPSAQYKSANSARQKLLEARKEAAYFLQCNSDEIVFTSGATESNNMAILGTCPAGKKGRVISIATEHSSIYEPLMQIKKRGYEVVMAAITEQGIIDLNALGKLLTKDTKLVTISYANSEIGNVQPISKVGQLINAYNASRSTKVLFHTDASAATLNLSCDVSRLGADLLSLGGAKIYGPHSSGILYVKRSTALQPLMFGGLQENGLRPGSEAIDSAAGIAKALSIAKSRRREDTELYRKLHNILLDELKMYSIEYCYNGHHKERIFNVLSLSLPSQNGEDLVARLDALGFEVATGAACEAGNELPSRSLLALGLSKSQAQSSLRVSFGRNTTVSEIKRFAKALSGIIQPL